MIYETPSIAITRSKEKLYSLGQKVNQEDWQSIKSPDDTYELLHHSIAFKIPNKISKLVKEVNPNLPWAMDQFIERVSGQPLNPGNTYMDWPFYKKTSYSDSIHRKQEKFSHTYMERFWPKKANLENSEREVNFGVRYHLGDYDDLINLLKKYPTTRQAYLPIFFPEDTGTHHGERIPCTIGYDFIIRNNFLHISYYMRSCDAIRHFRDDIFMACLLVFDIISKVNKNLTPGVFNMYIKSFHVFNNEKELLKYNKT